MQVTKEKEKASDFGVNLAASMQFVSFHIGLDRPVKKEHRLGINLASKLPHNYYMSRMFSLLLFII